MAFQREMEEEILPGVKRLAASIEVAGRVIVEIIRTFRKAEGEAASLFPEIQRLVAGDLPAQSWRSNELLVRDPNSLFTDKHMYGLIGSRYQGAGAELRSAMHDLMKDPDGAELDQALHRIAELRGRPYSEIKAEYDKFKLIRDQRDASGADPVPDLNTIAHPWFMGSNTQLRYGDVIGEAFGIDPVFGAMLNPTGGIVGPGNKGFGGDDTAVGYHGVFHDAAGYLYTYHEQAGPGYDYLRLEGRDTSHPYSGQRKGIGVWRRWVKDPISDDAQVVMYGVVGVVDAGSWVLDKARSIF